MRVQGCHPKQNGENPNGHYFLTHIKFNPPLVGEGGTVKGQNNFENPAKRRSRLYEQVSQIQSHEGIS